MIVTRMSKRDLQQDIMLINEQIDEMKKWEEPDWKFIDQLREKRDIKVEQIEQILKKQERKNDD